MNKCKYCGKKISDDKRFCSGACAARYYWIQIYGKFKSYKVKCHVCGKEFYIVEREKKFPVKERYFCSSHCSHSFSGSCGWNKRRKGSQSQQIKRLWENKRAYNQFRRITFFDILRRYSYCKKIALFLLVIFPFFYIGNVSFDRVKEDYANWRLENVFYVRTLGLRIDKEIIEKIFDYSVRFNKDFRLMLRWTYVESHFEPLAISNMGARGLMQVMPRTADGIVTIMLCDLEYKGRFLWTFEERDRMTRGYDLFNIDDNLLIAYTYINMLEKSSRTLEEVLAKYYSGSHFRSYITHWYVSSIKDFDPIKNKKMFDRI